MVQLSGAVVLAVAASTLFYVLVATFRERKELEHVLGLHETKGIKRQ
jgi:hypothetical protein